MRRQVWGAALCLAAAGCNLGDAVDESTEVTDRALTTGQTLGHFLVKPGYANEDELKRQAETDAYYGQVRVTSTGDAFTIRQELFSLAQFRLSYRFNEKEIKTVYYNKGDLGIGREMHCVDLMADSGQIACYVRNFASGDGDPEFTFGLSPDIAYANMKANKPFATVAMVYRDRMPVGAKDRVFFVVYDEHEQLSSFAALDRHGVNYAAAFKAAGNKNPGAEFGVPGGHFNNHIPSNCVTCHGGQAYDPVTHSQTGSLFLPFDLDQFEYDDSLGSRASQETAFKRMNEMVRKVAALSKNAAGTSIKNQLDTWYHNTTRTDDRTETFENGFDSNAVPSGWAANASAKNFYLQVFRSSCRTCHVSNSFGHTFETEAQFKGSAGVSAGMICGADGFDRTYGRFQRMPHALQTLREFWHSDRPVQTETYLRSIGETTGANLLHDCGPDDAVTLDPHFLAGID